MNINVDQIFIINLKNNCINNKFNFKNETIIIENKLNNNHLCTKNQKELHWNAWEYINKNNIKRSLILQNTSILTDNFEEIINKALDNADKLNNYSIIYLQVHGGELTNYIKKNEQNYLCDITNSHFNVSDYIITLEGVKNIFSKFKYKFKGNDLWSTIFNCSNEYTRSYSIYPYVVKNKPHYIFKFRNIFNDFNDSKEYNDKEFLKYCDQIFIISLKTNTLRRKSMIEQCNKIDLTNYDFFDGYDGNNLDIKLLQKQNILGNDDELSNLLLNNSKYYKGTIGCALSHWYCWKEILKRNIEYCMILEDDICFCDDFKRRFIRMIKRCNLVDWNIIHLHSYTHEKIRKSADFLPDDNDIKSSTIYIGDGEGGGTKGYIISKKIIQNTFLKVYSKVISAADEMTWFGTSSFYTISGGFCIKPYLITRNRQNDNNTNNGLNNKYDVTYNYTNNIISSDRCIIDNNHTI
jgi:GR25 family glycosyltransferase involved in LPS biosynthesis